jgi:hypothetical protein
MNHKGKIAAAMVEVVIVTIAALPLFVNVNTFPSERSPLHSHFNLIADNRSSTN